MGYMRNSGMNITFMPDDMKSSMALSDAVKDSGCDVTHSGMMEIGATMIGIYASAFVGYKLFKYMN